MDVGIFEINIQNVRPQDLDVNDLIAYLECAKRLLYPGKRPSENKISVMVREASTHLESMTDAKTVRITDEFIRTFIETVGRLGEDGMQVLEKVRVTQIEKLQNLAQKNNHQLQIRTLIGGQSGEILEITPETNYRLDHGIWAEVELMLYGEVEELGGKNSNLHLRVDEDTVVILEIGRGMIDDLSENIVFKTVGVRAVLRQNVSTGELASKGRCIELLDYKPFYNVDEIQESISLITESWRNAGDLDELLSQIRGRSDAA